LIEIDDELLVPQNVQQGTADQGSWQTLGLHLAEPLAIEIGYT
jgi:hypothetical protein